VTNPPDILETERLRLRKPALEDARVIFDKYAQDPKVTKYLTWHPNKSLEETGAFLRRCLDSWDEGKSFSWAIVRKQDEELLGMIESRVDGHKWELGYVLACSYWGKGYMTEAVQRVIDWALQQKEIHRVWSVCDIDNTASARVMEKAGMVREGILRRWSIHPNVGVEPRDSYCYSITKSDFARAARLPMSGARQ
jgi:ribosomal-protein-alanine N-acetyltransferase